MKFLILSDIHFIASAEEQDSNARMRKAFLKDLQDYVGVKDSFDYILISGDVANTGAEDEFKKAYKLINEICEIVKCATDRVFVVPGNHDKNFLAYNPELRHLINAGLSCETAKPDEKFTELLNKDFNNFKLLYRPFECYHNFALSFDSSEPMMQKIIDNSDVSEFDKDNDKLYLKSQLNDLGDYHVYLYCLNTSLISDWDDLKDDGTGHKQFLSSLGYNAIADSEGCINIAMMHHPLTHLVDRQKVESALDRNFQLQIYGHLHRSASSVENAIRIESGALQPPTEDGSTAYFSIYNIVELKVLQNDEKLDTLQVALNVQKYKEETNRFEEDPASCNTYTIPLKNHVNRWKQEKPAPKIALPEGITLRQVRVKFLQHKNRKALMGADFDEKKSINENSVRFLTKIESEGRLAELWNKMKQTL